MNKNLYLRKESILSTQPIINGFVVFKNNAILIHVLDKVLEINLNDKYFRNIIKKLFSLCNGINDIRSIFKHLSISKSNRYKLLKILKVLLEKEILIDSRKFFVYFHKNFVINPTRFYFFQNKEFIKKLTLFNDELRSKQKTIPLPQPQNSYFVELLKKRKSSRKFNPVKQITLRNLTGLLFSAYGIIEKNKIKRRTVPSGGALYPFHIYFVILKKITNLLPGVYYYKKSNHKILKIKSLTSIDEIYNIFPEEYKSMLNSASLLVILVVNFDKPLLKYANRGYTLSLLEAGHIAQNIYLYCTEQKLAVVELSAFKDEILSQFLAIPYPRWAPVVTLLIGLPDE